MQLPERKTVRVLCMNPDGEILLIKIIPIHLKVPYCWITPGGGVDVGESESDAVKRELFEETGIQNARFDPIPIKYQERIVTARGNTKLFKESFYLAHVDDNEFSREFLQPDEHQLFLEYKWWSALEMGKSQELIFPEDLSALLLNHTKISCCS